MTDIIERLRRYSYRQGTDDEQGQLIHELVSDMHDAADEIERLRLLQEDTALKCLHQEDEIEPTPEHLNDPYVLQLIEAISRLDDETERLREALEVDRKWINRRDDEIERLRDRNEVLEKSAEINRRIMDSYGPRFDKYDEEIERLRAALERIAAWYDGEEIASGELEQIIREALEDGDE